MIYQIDYSVQGDKNDSVTGQYARIQTGQENRERL